MRPFTPPLLPAALAAHTVESLHAMHGRRRPWVYWTALAAIGLALAALPLVEVDITVRAPGMVRPARERTEIRAALGGHLVRLRAQDNEQVTAGQVLAELSTGDAEERLARNRALQADKARQMEDLQALTTALTGDAPARAQLFPTLQTPALARAFAQFSAQVDAHRLVWAKAGAGLERAQRLAAKGLVTAQECEEARFARDRAVADLCLVVQQALSGWQVQLRDETTARDQLLSEEKRLRHELELAVIRAPASGSVQGLVGLGEGAFVAAGQSLGCVSPAGAWRVETWVAPRDIGLVRVGQSVRMQVDAFPYSQWGLLEGEVESVAADITAGGTQSAFRVSVRPRSLVLRRPDGGLGVLRRGMTLTARFTLGRRTLWEMLTQQLRRRLDPRGRDAAA